MVTLPALPHSWSELSWQQLCACWRVKMRYGGNADVARAAAMLELMDIEYNEITKRNYDITTGEQVFMVRRHGGEQFMVTARELSYTAQQALKWFDYPYGDPGEPVEKDSKGKIVKEAREPVRGYVSPLRDAMMPPEETIKIDRQYFALPQVACTNITWWQYRSLQGIVPQLHRDDVTDAEAVELQAQFLAHCLVPRSLALLDTNGGSIRLRPHWEYRYNGERADGLAKRFARHFTKELAVIFHVCFQIYQTAVAYYSQSYPLLFQDNGKQDPLRDALTGEIGTINTVMKYAGYAEQQQVYDSNLPFVLDILNTMTKEAKEVERMNAKIKRK